MLRNMRKAIAKVISPRGWTKNEIAQMAHQVRPTYKRQSYSCPICDYEGEFGPCFTSTAVRFDSRCPKCDSRERHRFFALVLKERGLDELGRVLHFAPEKALHNVLKARASDYVTADIQAERADLALNIEALDLPDGSFDTVVANHVLEHVDDRKAIPEILRVLKPGGRALVSVPVAQGLSETFEDDSIADPASRHRYYGQSDHVRLYGADVVARWRGIGATVDIAICDAKKAADHGMMAGDCVYVLTS